MKTTLIIAACALMCASCIPDSGRRSNHYYGIDDDDYEYVPIEEEVEVDDTASYQHEINSLLDDFEFAINRVAERTPEVMVPSLMTREVDRLNELVDKLADVYDRSRTTYEQDRRYDSLCTRCNEVADEYNGKFGFHDNNEFYQHSDSTAYY